MAGTPYSVNSGQSQTSHRHWSSSVSRSSTHWEERIAKSFCSRCSKPYCKRIARSPRTLLKPAQPYDVWMPAVPDPNLTPEQQQQQMATNPGFWTQSTEAKDRLKHMQNVVVNMQFLINELRPVQAKETLKLIMQMQLERRKQETQLIRE